MSAVFGIVALSVSIVFGVGMYGWVQLSTQNDGGKGEAQPLTRTACPCSDPSLCDPIQDTTRKEIFAFMHEKDSPSRWHRYDWTKLTTVAAFGHYSNPQLMCLAHQHGTRLVTTASFKRQILLNATARHSWTLEQLQYVKNNHLDGINFDFEEEVLSNETEIRNGYTSLVSETRSVFKKALPYSQVSVDVAWSPDNIDQRYYDYPGLAEASDLLFVMAYDEQSVIHGKCIAGSNSHYVLTEEGVKGYLTAGISPDKLVLAVPWYGYNYTCLSLTEDNECSIAHVPWRIWNCSDAAGSEIPYSVVMRLAKTSTSERLWDSVGRSPYFNYKDPNTGAIHQVRYDDPTSLKLKYQLALDLNLRGVGVYEIDDADDDSDTPENKQHIKEMWGVLPKY